MKVRPARRAAPDTKAIGEIGELPVGEVEKPRRRRNEPARVVVERRETFLEIDLQPIAPGLLRVARGDADDLCADATSLVIGADLRVDQERVVAAVPRNVHEPD